MNNPVNAALGATKQLAQGASVMMNVSKWFAAGLAVVAARALVLPLFRMVPFIRNLAEGGDAIAGAVMVVLGVLLAIPKFTLSRFVAAGLGIAGMITLVGAGITWVLRKVGVKAVA